MYAEAQSVCIIFLFSDNNLTWTWKVDNILYFMYKAKYNWKAVG